MPYEIEHTSPKCWTVKNTKTGEIKAKCTSQKKAEAQLRLLYGLESGWKPSTYKQMEKLHDLKPRRGKRQRLPSASATNQGADESDTEEGGYLESFKRKPGLLPPPVRKMLDTKGSVKISSIKIVRTPLSGFITSLLNVISLGAYQKAVKESPYDSMFHLAMLINGRYTTEKNEVIKLYQGTPVKKNSETFDLLVSKNITIGELFENGRKKMGDDNFTNYDARSNNCQDFLLGLLDGSGLTTDEARKFIKQDAEVIFKKMPSVSEKIGRFLTDVGAVGERVMEGEGQSKPCWKGYEMIGMKRKNGKKVPNCVPFKETWVVQGGRLVPVLVGSGPYKVYDSSPTCKSIINIDSGKVENHCLTESEAKKKQELLNRLYDEEKARLIVKKDVLDKKKKMPTARSWKDFYASQVKGKKFKNRQEVNAFMKECSKKWKEMKSKSGGATAPYHIPGEDFRVLPIAKKRQLLINFFNLVDNENLDQANPDVSRAIDYAGDLYDVLEQRHPNPNPDWTAAQLIRDLSNNVIASIPKNTINIIQRHRSRLNALLNPQP